MEKELYLQIVDIINSDKTDEEIRDLLYDYHENDIAASLEYLDKEHRFKLYRILGDDLTSEVLSYLDDASEYIEELSVSKAADIIELMDSDDAADVLEDLEDEHRSAIVHEMDPDAIEDIKLINTYDDDLVGSRITNNYIVINKSCTVKQAMRELIKQASDNDNVSIINVVNDDDTYYGIIDLRDLIVARSNSDLADIIKENYPVLNANNQVSDVINEIKDYGLESIPVVDNENHLIGIVTSDIITETVDDELSDDYAKLAGLTEEEEDNNIFKSMKKRLPWLAILLVIDILVSLLASSFEHVVVALPLLVFFQSMILDMGGNAGTQSLAVTIRLLSEEKVDKKVAFKCVLKELCTGFLNGLFFGIIGFGLFMLYFTITKPAIILDQPYTVQLGLKASGVISIALVLSMAISSLVGCVMPIIFKLIHVDPAVASGPFITTINDIVSICVYYGLAYLMIVMFL